MAAISATTTWSMVIGNDYFLGGDNLRLWPTWAHCGPTALGRMRPEASGEKDLLGG